MPANKCRRNDGIRSHHFANPNGIVDVINSHQWIPKSLGKKLKGNILTG